MSPFALEIVSAAPDSAPRSKQVLSVYWEGRREERKEREREGGRKKR